MSDPKSIPSSSSSSSSSKPPTRSAYVSRGQVLQSPPLAARINNTINTLYNIGGLYVTSLFSLDPYNAAQNSRFNLTGPERNTGHIAGGGNGGGRALGGAGGGGNTGSSWFGWGSGNGGNGGSGGPGNGGRRIGRVDDVRAPECGSCR